MFVDIAMLVESQVHLPFISFFPFFSHLYINSSSFHQSSCLSSVFSIFLCISSLLVPRSFLSTHFLLCFCCPVLPFCCIPLPLSFLHFFVLFFCLRFTPSFLRLLSSKKCYSSYRLHWLWAPDLLSLWSHLHPNPLKVSGQMIGNMFSLSIFPYHSIHPFMVSVSVIILYCWISSQYLLTSIYCCCWRIYLALC